jgi:phosphatidylglycerol lysyltransferase
MALQNLRSEDRDTGEAKLGRHVGWLQKCIPLLSLVLFGFGIAAIHHLLAELSYRDLLLEIETVPVTRLLAAIVFTAGSFLALTGYDWLALSLLGHRLPYPIVALASFCGYAISNTLGFSLLSSGSVRLRLYLSHGVDVAGVARMSIVTLVALIMGTVTVGASAMLIKADLLAPIIGVSPMAVRGLGIGLLLPIAALVCYCYKRQRPWPIGHFELTLPSGNTASLQLLFAAIDVLCAGACLYVLIDVPSLPVTVVLAVYATALLLGLVSQLPGGFGVFESVILLGLKDYVPASTLTVALVGYRAIYYFLPLVLALAILFIIDARAGLLRTLQAAERLRGVGAKFIPATLGILTFLNGLVLLLSTATPAIPARLNLLEAFVPIVLVEVSTLGASVVGVALLLLARGLMRKLNGAYLLALILCSVGSLTALAKGIDYEEGAFLSLTAFALYVSRAEFYRRTKLIDAPFTWSWIVAVLAAVIGMVWIVLFSYKHVDYGHSLWWQFEYDAEASRSLRATLAVMVSLVLFGLYRLLRVHTPTLCTPKESELQLAENIIRSQNLASANLALMGDKHLLFSVHHDAMLMYGVHDGSWIALGDPIGAPESASELAWQLRECADRVGGRLGFYQCTPAHLPLYLDMGLEPLKLGEEAVVLLPEFKLEGARHKTLRQSAARAQRDGLSFEIVERSRLTPGLLAQLAEISMTWLDTRNAREKGFSLGHFDVNYLCRFDLALVHHAGRIIAFANLFTTATKVEASLDMMRYVPSAPKSVMDFLFVELLLHFKREAYQRFMLGMAPLSGLRWREFAPLWYRLGHQIFLHGEHFYNFRGLRDFKEKFSPVWEPRYLLTEGGINPLVIMADTAALVARGLGGIFQK